MPRIELGRAGRPSIGDVRAQPASGTDYHTPRVLGDLLGRIFRGGPQEPPRQQPNLLDEIDQFNQQETIPNTPNIPDEAVSDAMLNWMEPGWLGVATRSKAPHAGDFEMLRADPGSPAIDRNMPIVRMGPARPDNLNSLGWPELIERLNDPTLHPDDRAQIMQLFGLWEM